MCYYFGFIVNSSLRNNYLRPSCYWVYVSLCTPKWCDVRQVQTKIFHFRRRLCPLCLARLIFLLRLCFVSCMHTLATSNKVSLWQQIAVSWQVLVQPISVCLAQLSSTVLRTHIPARTVEPEPGANRRVLWHHP